MDVKTNEIKENILKLVKLTKDYQNDIMYRETQLSYISLVNYCLENFIKNNFLDGKITFKTLVNIMSKKKNVKMNPLLPKHHVPYKYGNTFTIPESLLKYPKGWGKFKCLPHWNQRKIR